MKRKMGKNEFERIKDIIAPILSKGDSRTRGKVGEYLSGIEFLKNKWEVYEPIQDAYVDFILKSGNKFRTIQVKTSKLDVDKKFKVDCDPKDILHDPRHFFVWFFFDQFQKDGKFIVTTPKEFCDYLMSGRRHGVIVDTWRKDQSREEIKLIDIESEKGEFRDNVNNWSILSKENENVSLVGIQEKEEKWKDDKKFLKQWKKNKKILKEKLADKNLQEDHVEIIDGKTRVRKRINGIKIKNEVLKNKMSLTRKKSMKYLQKGTIYGFYKYQGMNIFENIEKPSQFLKLKIECKKCNELWEADEKECYECKIWRPPVVVCKACKKINKQEAQECWSCKQKISKICIGCNKGIESKNTVPLTYCIMCGSRNNKFNISKVVLSELITPKS